MNNDEETKDFDLVYDIRSPSGVSFQHSSGYRVFAAADEVDSELAETSNPPPLRRNGESRQRRARSGQSADATSSSWDKAIAKVNASIISPDAAGRAAAAPAKQSDGWAKAIDRVNGCAQ